MCNNLLLCVWPSPAKIIPSSPIACLQWLFKILVWNSRNICESFWQNNQHCCQRKRERDTRCDSMVFHIGKSSFALYDNKWPIGLTDSSSGLVKCALLIHENASFSSFSGPPNILQSTRITIDELVASMNDWSKFISWTQRASLL
jgi:hypothetical protein